jgi:hypothetical protein
MRDGRRTVGLAGQRPMTRPLAGHRERPAVDRRRLELVVIHRRLAGTHLLPRLHLARFHLARLSVARLSVARLSVARVPLARVGLGRLRLARLGLARLGLVLVCRRRAGRPAAERPDGVR